MDIITIAFIVGIALGTVSGLLFVKLSGKETISTTVLGPRRISPTTSTPIPRSSKSRIVKPRASHKSRVRIKAGHGKIEPAGPETALTLQPVVSSCPACGLQAPEHLMTEHFLGSPSHQSGPTPDAIPVEIIAEPAQDTEEEDSRSAMRHLLQMLVPPRAFGRRHAQRTVNPLSRLVQTLEDTQSALVQPLRRP